MYRSKSVVELFSIKYKVEELSEMAEIWENILSINLVTIEMARYVL